MRSGWRRSGLLLFLVGLAACRPAAGPLSVKAAAWPAADALFRRDPRWLGADAAFSVVLEENRILWLFGDTFVARTPARQRSQSTLVRNTVAVQSGRDPTTAAISFFWRGTAEAPASFFPEEGGRWYWPQHGIRLGRSLVVFLSQVAAAPGQGLGFRVTGWRAAMVDDASGSPARWQPRLLVPSRAPVGRVLGAGLSRVGDHVLSLAVEEPGSHAGYLVRWRVQDLAAGRIDATEWWAAEAGWVAGAERARAVLADAGPESSLHFDARLRHWVHVRTQGFGASTIVVSFAPEPQGPWTAPRSVFRPEESDRRLLVYAAKAHPGLSGADLVVTYASNALDFRRVVQDSSIYFPRFVRLTISEARR
jgi:hypothetical protein